MFPKESVFAQVLNQAFIGCSSQPRASIILLHKCRRSRRTCRPCSFCYLMQLQEQERCTATTVLDFPDSLLNIPVPGAASGNRKSMVCMFFCICATILYSLVQQYYTRSWLWATPGSPACTAHSKLSLCSQEAAYLKVCNQLAGLLAQGAMVGDIPSRLHQQQVIKGLEDVDAGLVDGAHHCASSVHCVTHSTHDNGSSPCIQPCTHP